MKIIKEILLYVISLFIPKEKQIVFGSWNGRKYGDNPGYLAEYLLKIKSRYKLYWAGNKSVEKDVPEGIIFLDTADSKTKWKLMKMKYVFVSHSINDISQFNVFGRSTIVLTWHGIGIKALKNLQSDTKLRSLYRKLFRNYNYFLASSEKSSKRILYLFKSYGANKNNVLLTGQSRSVALINFKKKPKKNMILYLPTFRKENQFSFTEMTIEQKNKLNCLLNKYDYYIIEKRHPKELDLFSEKNDKRINYLKDDVKLENLMLKSSLLITDYSSVVFDYLLLDRPIIHYTYDLNSYLQGASGIYYEFKDIAPGLIANNFDELLAELENTINKENYGKSKRNEFIETMVKYDDGKASERITEYFNLY